MSTPERLEINMSESDMSGLASAFAQAIKSQDDELLRSVTTDDVVWSLPGHSIISGDARGAREILRRSQRLADYGVDIAIVHMVYGLTGFGLLLHNTGTRLGRILDEHLTTVFQLRGKLIARMDTYISDVAMLNQYFAKPEAFSAPLSETVHAIGSH